MLQELMQAYPFALLVSEIADAPFASHLPFLLDPRRGEFGTLRAHMARPNPQWHGFEAEKEALVIFQGPHAYISPLWYAVQPAVPTWNFAAVHAYGVPRCVEPTVLHEILVDTVAAFEAPDPGFTIPEDYFAKMERGVVGFEIEITRLEGKFKMSQNRSEEDRLGVIRSLTISDRPGDREVAAWMQSAKEAN